jgi:general transcription factor 3C polypeptide 3 (transcription factor C subunit 4)
MIAGSRTVASKADHRIRKPPQAPPEPQSEDDDSADSGDDEEAVQDMHLVTQPMRAAPMPGYRPERPLVPRKRGILLEFLYGQTLASARSWQGAIGKRVVGRTSSVSALTLYAPTTAYYLRAYRMDPYDSLICLSLAHAYLARSLQRQCDNKMHMTTLGVTFLNRYRAIRKQDASDDLLEEIEYNFGRAFHGIGESGKSTSARWARADVFVSRNTQPGR